MDNKIIAALLTIALAIWTKDTKRDSQAPAEAQILTAFQNILKWMGQRKL